MAIKKGTLKNDKIIGSKDNDTVTGLAGTDTLNGGLGNDFIDGGADNDLLNGEKGNDTLLGGDGEDTLNGGSENDKLDGGKDNDILNGDAGKDTLDGGIGADKMTGGDGNDYYFVDNVKDMVIEDAKKAVKIGGDDTVETALADYKLSESVENLVLVGKLASKGSGNKIGNKITGNDANNVLNGLGGNDSLTGGKGADTLDGGAGMDTLAGGNDSDSYFVDNKSDKIVEEATGGTLDFVNSIITFDLHSSPNVEALQLSGAKAIAGTGNELANLIQEADKGKVNNNFKGMDGDDTLNGEGGNDTLDGGEGNDVIDGGDGKDTVIFSNAKENYSITTNTATENGIDQVIVKYLGAVDDAAIIAEGKDILTNVEMLQFSDGILNVSDIKPISETTTVNHKPTGKVAISGTTTVGETLKVANSLKDADGLGAFNYQWLKNGAPIAGATEKTYVLTESDIGKSLKVKVGYTDGANKKEAVTSDKTALIQEKAEVEILPNQLSVDKKLVNEGESVTFKLIAPNAVEGDQIGFELGGTIAEDDILGGLPEPIFYVDADGTAEITVGFKNDKLTEGKETLSLTLLDEPTLKATVTVKDTSVGKTGVPDLGVMDEAGIDAELADQLAADEAAALAADEAAALADATLIDNGDGTFAEMDGATVDSGIAVGVTKKGTAGNDKITGTAGNDILSGSDGNDTLNGLEGNDSLDGGRGDDVLDGGNGNDILSGGDGNDLLLAGSGNNLLDGGSGVDVAFYNGFQDDYQIVKSGTQLVVQSISNGGSDVLKNIEVLQFSEGSQINVSDFISDEFPIIEPSIDTIAPVAPVFNVVAGDDVIDSAEQANGVVINGESEVGSMIALTFMDGSRVSVVASDDSTWSYYLTAENYAAGVSQIIATAIDAAGNVSEPVFKAVLLENAKLPIAVPNAASTAIVVEGDAMINAAEATAGVTASLSLLNTNAIADDVIELFINGTSSLKHALTSADIAVGVTNFLIPAESLGIEGEKVLTSAITNAVGTSEQSPPLFLTVDTTAPVQPLLGTTNDTIVVNQLEVGALWKFSTDGGIHFTNGTGDSFVLAAGVYQAGSIQVNQTDVAGNVSVVGLNANELSIGTAVVTPHENIIQLASGAIPQTISGADGVKDIFVFDYASNSNGVLGDFGQVTVNNYNKAEGDVIRLHDVTGNVVIDAITGAVTSFSAAVHSNAGNAQIAFNDDPSINGATEQTITLMGITTTKTFGATLADVSATFEFV